MGDDEKEGEDVSSLTVASTSTPTSTETPTPTLTPTPTMSTTTPRPRGSRSLRSGKKLPDYMVKRGVEGLDKIFSDDRSYQPSPTKVQGPVTPVVGNSPTGRPGRGRPRKDASKTMLLDPKENTSDLLPAVPSTSKSLPADVISAAPLKGNGDVVRIMNFRTSVSNGVTKLEEVTIETVTPEVETSTSMRPTNASLSNPTEEKRGRGRPRKYAWPPPYMMKRKSFRIENNIPTVPKEKKTLSRRGRKRKAIPTEEIDDDEMYSSDDEIKLEPQDIEEHREELEIGKSDKKIEEVDLTMSDDKIKIQPDLPTLTATPSASSTSEIQHTDTDELFGIKWKSLSPTIVADINLSDDEDEIENESNSKALSPTAEASLLLSDDESGSRKPEEEKEQHQESQDKDDIVEQDETKNTIKEGVTMSSYAANDDKAPNDVDEPNDADREMEGTEIQDTSSTKVLDEPEHSTSTVTPICPETETSERQTSSPQPRRSMRCPKKKPAPVVEATMAVERDANPYQETCLECGEEFNKKSLYSRHLREHRQDKLAIQEKEKSEAQALPSADADMTMEEEDDAEDTNGIGNDSLDQEGLENREGGSTDQRFPSRQPVTCDQCGMTFTRRAHLNRHMLLHSDVRPYECDICRLGFTRKDHMLSHRLKHEKEERPKCHLCDAVFKSSQALQNHIKTGHTINQVMERPSPSKPPLNPSSMTPNFICPVCGKEFQRKRYLTAHYKIHKHQEAGVIAQLQKAEADARNVEYMSDEDPGMSCDDEVNDIDENMLNPEVILEDGDKMQDSPLKSQTNTNKRNSSPTSSASGSSAKKRLKTHRLLKMAEEYSPPISKENSPKNVEEANQEKNAIEDLISYDYKAMMQLKESEKPNGSEEGDDMDGYDGDGFDNFDQQQSSQGWECSVCGLPFTDRSDLRKHYRIHKRRFICRFCGLRMASAGSLMRHNLIHTGKKEFGCKLCPRRFSRKDTLAVHLQAHQKSTTRAPVPKPYCCRLCGSSYTMKYNLIRHIRVCHGSLTNRAALLKQIKERYSGGVEDGGTFDETEDAEFEGLFDEEGNMLEEEDAYAEAEASGKRDDSGEVEMNDFDMEEGDDEVVPTPTAEELRQCEQDEIKPGDSTMTSEGFDCNHCGKIFKNTKSLNTHKWYHSRPKKFICPVCNKGFMYPTDLSRHINTHNQNGDDNNDLGRVSASHRAKSKPLPTSSQIKQNIDQASFGPTLNHFLEGSPAAQTNRSGYQARNNDPFNMIASRPFGCKLCPQRFNHRSNLSRHVRLVHNGVSKPPNSPRSMVDVESIIAASRAQTQPKLGPKSQKPIPSLRPVSIQQRTLSFGESSSSSSWNEDGKGQGQGRAQGLTSLTFAQPQRVEVRKLSPMPQILSPDSFIFDPSLDRPYICKQCGKSFENKNNIWTHMRIHNKMFVCDYCDLRMATRGDMILHLRTHTGEKPYGCHLCEWRFSRKSGLNKHLEKYHGPDADVKQLRPFKPDTGNNLIPEQKTKMNTLRQRMVESGMEIKEIPGSYMNMNMNKEISPQGFSVSMSDNLGGMVITRTEVGAKQPNAVGPNLTKHTCRICNKVLLGKNNYLSHVHYHVKADQQSLGLEPNGVQTGTQADTPPNFKKTNKTSNINDNILPHPNGWFTCKLCRKTFKDKKQIDAHMYYHNREEKHFCPGCGARFKQNSDLQRHIRIHHSSTARKNKLSCPHCSRCFTDIRYMSMHVRRYHSNNGAPATITSNPEGEENLEAEDQEMQVSINPEVVLEGLDAEDASQKSMEDMEYRQYQNEQEDDSDGSGGFTISCEDCGQELEPLAVAEHICE